MTGDTSIDVYNGSFTGNSTATNITFDLSELIHADKYQKLPIVMFGEQFYAYTTPVIFAVGLIGNFLSLCVFLSKNLRHMSASRYLAALSTVDISTLVFYVFCEWLKRGVQVISPGNRVRLLDTPGICQVWLYLNYVSRFLSAWLIVAFTCERYIGVCLPLRRRNLGSLKETTRIIACLTIVSCLAVVYKPILSGTRTLRNRQACGSKEQFIFASFILDSVFALSITFIPFVIIATLNSLIIKRLIRQKLRRNEHLVTAESHIRLEFTFILLAVSFFFMTLNVPYFIVWVRNFLHSWPFNTSAQRTDQHETRSYDFWIGVLSITRTLFYMNYCINFFLYSIAGAYFRRELKALFFKTYSSYEPCTRTYNTRTTHIRNNDARV